MLNSFKAHDDQIVRILQLPNGYVATASNDKRVKIWDPSNNSNWILIRNYTGHQNAVFAVDYISADTIASGSSDGTIRIWYISTGVLVKQIIVGYVDVLSLQLLSNSFHLAAGLSNKSLTIYNINDSSIVSTLQGHTESLRDLKLIGNNLLASSSNDQTIRIWDLKTNTPKFVLTGHTGIAYGLKLISCDLLASGSSDSTIKLWNITNGILIRTLANHTSYIYNSVDLLSDGVTLVSGSWDKTVKLWNILTGELLNTLSTDMQISSLAAFKSKNIYEI